jgi:hypothetical protein
VAFSIAFSFDIALAVVEGHWQLIENGRLITSDFLYGEVLWSFGNVNKLLLIIYINIYIYFFVLLVCIGTTSKQYFEVLFLSVSCLVLYVVGLWPTLILSFLFCLHEDPVNSEASSDRITIFVELWGGSLYLRFYAEILGRLSNLELINSDCLN